MLTRVGDVCPAACPRGLQPPVNWAPGMCNVRMWPAAKAQEARGIPVPARAPKAAVSPSTATGLEGQTAAGLHPQHNSLNLLCLPESPARRAGAILPLLPAPSDPPQLPSPGTPKGSSVRMTRRSKCAHDGVCCHHSPRAHFSRAWQSWTSDGGGKHRSLFTLPHRFHLHNRARWPRARGALASQRARSCAPGARAPGTHSPAGRLPGRSRPRGRPPGPASGFASLALPSPRPFLREKAGDALPKDPGGPGPRDKGRGGQGRPGRLEAGPGRLPRHPATRSAVAIPSNLGPGVADRLERGARSRPSRKARAPPPPRAPAPSWAPW